MERSASVIVRCKDKVDTIEHTFLALRRQTHPVEIVVVDSGSTDGTLDIARQYADVLVEMAPEDFTFGRALNLGASRASGDVHFALSAHCAPYFDDWIERSCAHYDDPRVAGTNQSRRRPDGTPFDGTYLQSLQDAQWWPHWGFSNHGSSWHSRIWRALPFREDLRACEDKEWSWRVLHAGWTIVYDPRLSVPSGHRRDAGVLELHRRVRRENEALAELGALPAPTLRDLRREWWGHFNPDSRYPKPVLRISPWRLAELSGAFLGARTARRVPGPLHGELTGGLADSAAWSPSGPSPAPARLPQ
jgi:rhamnosyltransferase